jgi:hypothetical protein
MSTHRRPDVLEAYAMWRNEGLTPLTSIAGYSDLLLRGAFGSLTDEQTNALTVIRQQVSKSIQSWDNYGDYLRVYHSETKHDIVAVTELFEEVKQRIQYQTGPIELSLPDTPLTLNGDSQKLRIAFCKLVYPDEEAHRIHTIQPIIRAHVEDTHTLVVHIRSGLEASSQDEWLWHPMAGLGMAAFVIKQHQGDIQTDYASSYSDYCVTLPMQQQE